MTRAVLLCLLLGTLSCVSSVELTDEQHENLPDFGDPQIAGRLKCSACRGSATEAFEALAELRARRGKLQNIKEHEYTELMETLCDDRIGAYGLQLRNNLPTQKFSKDKAISRAQGNWAGRYISNICGELTTDFEGALIEHQMEELSEFVDTICRKEMQVCNRKTIDDDTLGDELSPEYQKRKEKEL
mmetsp:Transcript_50941/g.102160  ORF Transcript_50941/g.102160 Transcript_50941/m.102160 type:complete len:187 (+) Transcript_50941:8-568(+)